MSCIHCGEGEGAGVGGTESDSARPGVCWKQTDVTTELGPREKD
jgi:hypothetical protein